MASKLLGACIVAAALFPVTALALPEEVGNQMMQAYARNDFQAAYTLIKPYAEKGDADAQYNLGLMYANGESVKQDYAQARYWYEKAAAQGNNMAQNNLGTLYANGQGVAKDMTKAQIFWKKAAAQGNQNAQQNLEQFARH